MMGESGIAVIKEICRRWGTRPKTLIHGDGHPGNLFQHKPSKEYTWIDWQLYTAGPPGFEIAQGIGLGLQKPSKAAAEEVAKGYYAELLKQGPPGLAEEYTYDMLWEDMLCGMLLWNTTYVYVNCTALPNLKNEEDGGELRLRGLRAVYGPYVVAGSVATRIQPPREGACNLHSHSPSVWCAARPRSMHTH